MQISKCRIYVVKKIKTTVFWKVPVTCLSLLSFIEVDIRVMAAIMWNNVSGKTFWLELLKVYISLVLHDDDGYPGLMIYAFEKKWIIFYGTCYQSYPIQE